MRDVSLSASRIAMPAAFVFVAAGMVARYLPFWSIFELNPDEGGNLAKSVLVGEGFRLYRDIWSDQPPLLTWLCAAVFEWTGASMTAGRGLVFAFAALLLVSLYSLLQLNGGRVVACVGVALVLLSSSFVVLSVSFMIGLPSMSLFVAALACAERAEVDPTRGNRWLAVAGILAAACLATKLFLAPPVVFLGLDALRRNPRRAASYFAGLGLTLALVAWACGLDALPQLIEAHAASFLKTPYESESRILLASQDAALLLLGGVGSLVALGRRQFLPVLCFLHGIGALVFHRPLHTHHVVLYSIPAAWLAAIALQALCDRLRQWSGASRLARHVLAPVGVVIFVIYGSQRLALIAEATTRIAQRDEQAREVRQVIVSTVRAYRGQNRWVLTDRPIYAIRAGLLPLPELAVFSHKRMELLRQGAADFFNRLLVKYRQPQVLLMRHPEYPTAFMQALSRNYLALPRHFQQTRHFVKADALPAGLRPNLDGLRESIEHYRRSAPSNYPRYTDHDFVRIAGNLLLLQNDDGGWSANSDPRAVFSEEYKRELAEQHAAITREFLESRGDADLSDLLTGSSFDNGTTTAEIPFLLRVFALTGETQYRDGAVRGIEYLLEGQTGCGGWPHSFPATMAYHRHITLMDDVTVRALALARQIGLGRPPFDTLPEALQQQSQEAFVRGLGCLLRLQQRIDGRLAGWAGQYDAQTLAPATARAFELPGLSSRETVAVVQLLLQLPEPTPDVIAAVEAAVDWLRRSRVRGFQVQRVPLAPGSDEFDLRLAPAARAAPLWARFYELGTNRPFFADRDGRKHYDWSELSSERRLGYEWYGAFAETLLARDHPAWRRRRGG